MRVNIEAERARNMLSKEALANKLNISLKTYYNWINEETDIPGMKLAQMASMFNTTMEYLIESVVVEKKT